MPVWKFRSFEEAERALWLPTGDPSIADRLRSLWRASWDLSGRFVPPRGVFKFRSMQEANAHREAWENERIARIQQKWEVTELPQAENSLPSKQSGKANT